MEAHTLNPYPLSVNYHTEALLCYSSALRQRAAQRDSAGYFREAKQSRSTGSA